MNATTPDQTIVIPIAFAWMITCDTIEYSAGLVTAPVTQSVTKPGPPRFGSQKTPVSRAPTMPPTACTPNTSSESSALIIRFRPDTPHRHATPAIAPMKNAPGMPTLPAAGVIATSPATAPEAAPSIEGLPLNIHSKKHHESTAHAVAR